MEPEQIAMRCKQVGLSLKRLAELADLDLATVDRTFNNRSRPYHDTVKKMQTALTGFERERLRHLATLHPRDALEAATLAMCPSRAPANRAEAA